MKVGFIGLGMMGGHMATNIQKAGHQLIVTEISQNLAKARLDAGAIWADTPKQVAADSDIVLTSLPGPPEVEAVALGKNGLIEGIKKDQPYFDLSTNSPTTMRKIHAIFAEKGAYVLDAPVSGGPKGAETRKLALWIGGDKSIYEKYKPIIDAMGDQPFYVGDIGAGSVVKLVHNCASVSLNVMLSEVFTMGVKAGVEPLALWELVRQGAMGRRPAFDSLPDNFLINKFDPPNFALKLSHKDMALATALGREVGVPMPMCNVAFADMQTALNRGWGHREGRAVMLIQEERSNVNIAVDPAKMKAVTDRLFGAK